MKPLPSSINKLRMKYLDLVQNFKSIELRASSLQGQVNVEWMKYEVIAKLNTFIICNLVIMQRFL